MSVIGIIAEYNPFHNGHLYQLQKAKEMTKSNFVVVVLSGHFLQRGEPAIFNKWCRAKMALSCGVDLVIEIPFVFSSQNANGFASAGVRLLDQLGIIDYLSFGYENGTLELFYEIAELLIQDPVYLKNILKAEIKKGYTYPRIRSKAILQYLKKKSQKCDQKTFSQIENTLEQPNNILALEYIQSLIQINSQIKPLPIRRIGSSYSETSLAGKFSSATAIRNVIMALSKMTNQDDILESISTLKSTMPGLSLNILLEQILHSINPISLSSFENIILFNLRKMSLSDLKMIHGVSEGLENRIKKAALNCKNIQELIAMIKTKRYTHTRIQRILVHSLFNLSKHQIIEFNHSGPQYCRILGMNEKGKYLLKKMKANCQIPIVIKMNHFLHSDKQSKNDLQIKMLEYDILATNTYVLGYHSENLKKGNQDFTQSIVLP